MPFGFKNHSSSPFFFQVHTSSFCTQPCPGPSHFSFPSAHKQIAHNHAQRLRFISSLPYQIAHKWNRLHPSAQICPQVHRLHTSRPSHFSFPSAPKWNRLHPNQVKHKFHIPHMLHNASTKILQVLRFTASSHKKASLTTRLTKKASLTTRTNCRNSQESKWTNSIINKHHKEADCTS